MYIKQLLIHLKLSQWVFHRQVSFPESRPLKYAPTVDRQPAPREQVNNSNCYSGLN